MPTTLPEAEVEEPLSMSWSIGRVLAVAAMAAMAIFWAVVFRGIPKKE